MLKKETNTKNGWVVVGDSVMGHSHQKNNTPCQDSHYYELGGEDWGVAVVCDGAGSEQHAHHGAAFLARETGLRFMQRCRERKWFQSLPSSKEWQEEVKLNFRALHQKLAEFAEMNQVSTRDLSSTLIIVVFTARGLACAHIGDGRAGYQDKEGEWKPLLSPWKGEYANETIFFSSDIWEKQTLDQYLKTTVVAEEVRAFALLSDGCERHSFICNVWDENKQKYDDPNQPFDKFFNPVIANLKQMAENRLPHSEMKAKWSKFLKAGNTKLEHEPDDKTMIIGARL